MDGRERGVAAEIVIGRTTTTAGSSHFPEIKAIRIICQRNNFCLSFSQQKMKELGCTKKKQKKTNYHFPSSHHLSSSKHLNNWIYLIKNFNYFFKKFHSNNYKLEPIVATRQDQCSSLSSWTAGSSKSHGSVCNDPPLLYLHAASSRLLLPATSWTAVPKAPEKKKKIIDDKQTSFLCVSAAGAHKCDVLIRPIGTFQFHLSFVTVKVINFPRPANVLPFFFSAKNSRGYIKWKSILSRNVTWCPVSATSNKLKSTCTSKVNKFQIFPSFQNP